MPLFYSDHHTKYSVQYSRSLRWCSTKYSAVRVPKYEGTVYYSREFLVPYPVRR